MTDADNLDPPPTSAKYDIADNIDDVGDENEAVQICDNAYLPSLHKPRGACQVCVFRLSEEDKKKLEKNKRHLLVNMTHGGCVNCRAFPSQEGEDPVRLCRQCFFDTHKLKKNEVKPFSGPSGLSGMAALPSRKRLSSRSTR